MKVIHSSIFRAVCAIIVGVLLIQYREQTVTWITIAIGVLFFLSGVISLASYWAAKRNAEKMQGQILSDSNGKPIMGMIPKFPLVSVGSLILGLLLALMPQVFIAWLMFILAFILILGALTQFANLASAAKMGRVGILFWLFPSALLLLGLLAIIKPSARDARAWPIRPAKKPCRGIQGLGRYASWRSVFRSGPAGNHLWSA